MKIFDQPLQRPPTNYLVYISTKMKKEHVGSLERTNYESGIKRSMNEKYKIICIIPLSHMQQFLLLILSFPDIFLL